MIGAAGGEHRARDLGVPCAALRLMHDIAVPMQAKPIEPVDDRVHRLARRARAIGVLDPQAEQAGMMLREQPIEERRARAANVKEAGGRGGEADDDGHDRAVFSISGAVSTTRVFG